MLQSLLEVSFNDLNTPVKQRSYVRSFCNLAEQGLSGLVIG